MKLKLLFMAIGLSSTLTQNIEATAWKQGAKRLFHAGCTLTGATLAVGPGLYQVNELRKDLAEKDAALADGRLAPINNPIRLGISRIRALDLPVVHSVDAVLKRCGVTDPVILATEEIPGGGPGMAIGDGIFYFSRKFFDEYSEEKYAFIIAHEAGHAVNKDVEKRASLLGALTVIIFGGSKLFKRTLFSKKHISNPTVIRSVLKTPAGAGMAAASYAVYKLLWSSWESRADRHAISCCTPQEIRAGAEDFRKSSECEKEFKADGVRKGAAFYESVLSSDALPEWRKFFVRNDYSFFKYLNSSDFFNSSLVYRIRSEHPKWDERVEYLEQEAAKKEALENNQGVNL